MKLFNTHAKLKDSFVNTLIKILINGYFQNNIDDRMKQNLTQLYYVIPNAFSETNFVHVTKI